MARIDKIKQALKELSPVDKISLHNIRSTETGNYDDVIYENDEEFFNMNYPNNPHEAVRATFYGDFRYMDEYISLADNGNVVSFEERDLEKYIDDNLLAEYFDENPDELEDLEIEEEEPNEVSEDRYWEMLEVLPPFYFNTLNGKKVSGGFAVSEPNRHISTPDGFKATYNGFYKKDGKYFEIGEVYFTKTDSDGEVDGYSDDTRNAKTVNPEAFGLGGIFRKIFGGRKVQTGRAWTNDHYHHNKSEDYEIPMADRKHFAKGGGVRDHNGREYSFGRAWTNDHRHQNLGEDYEVEMYERKRKYATGGMVDLFEDYEKIPSKVKRILDKYSDEFGGDGSEMDYKDTKNMLEDVEAVGYTFSYGLDNEPFGLRPINTPLSKVIGYEDEKEYAKGGLSEHGLMINDIITKDLGNDEIIVKGKNGMFRTVNLGKGLRYGNGGGLKNTTYIPNRDIESLKTNYGKTISGKRLVDGAYAKGNLKKPKVSRTQFEEETFEYKTGGGLQEWSIGNFQTIPNWNSKVKPNGMRIEEDVDGYPIYKDGKVIYVHKTKKQATEHFNRLTKKYGTGGTMDSSTFGLGGKTPKQPIAFEHSNLYFNGYGIDINGNKVVRVSFPNSRAFSIQTNGTLPKTYRSHGTMEFDEAEINAYVKEFGSPAQKKKLKIYKK